MSNQTQTTNWFIHSKLSDTLFIIATPLFAFLVVALVCAPRTDNYIYSSLTPIWFAVMASVLTHAHVLLVFTRSHFNKAIFTKYKMRFTLVPIALLIAMWFIPPLFLALGFIGIYWDEWHSLMQTFGFGRIYDMKKGNDPKLGRKLDMAMAFVVGLLPNVVLLTFLPKTQVDNAFAEYLEMPILAVKEHGWLIESLRFPLIAFGIGFVIYYFYFYYQQSKKGYSYPYAKIALFTTTGITTVLIASFFTIADGVFFGNIYHAIQYIFIVYIHEKNNLSEIATKKPAEHDLLTPQKKESYEKNKKLIGILVFFLIVIPLIFILSGVRQITQHAEYIAAFWLLTSLMHFWFDGFIWSVRKKEV